MIRFRLSMCICLLFGGMQASVTPTDFAYVLETFLNSSGQKWLPNKDDFKALDFYTTGRLAVPMGPLGLNLVFDLGGNGAGSPFLPLPPAQRPYIDFDSNLPPIEEQARIALFKILQDQIFGGLARDVFGANPSGAVDFFAEDGGEASQKQHIAERIFSFKVTPAVVYALKLGLLAKNMTEKGKDAFSSVFSYLADFGILTFRLLRAWKRDSRVAGGLSAAIEENAPEIGSLFRKISKTLPESTNPTHDELFIHRKLDSGWKMIMEGGGIAFAADGSVARGLGFAVSALECRTAEEAQFLAAFLSQKQINWDKIETQDMVGKSFVTRVGSLLEMYGAQIENLPEEQRAEREAQYVKLDAIFEHVVKRNAFKQLGRFDLDLTNNETAHPLLKRKEFTALVHEGGPLSSYSVLPKVIAAGNSVYYCTNETGPVEAGKLVAVIFFHALWKYLEVIRGSNEMSAQLTAEIKEKERMQQSARAYLATEEANFLRLPLGLLMERPSVDFYAIAAKYFPKEEERKKAVEVLVEDAKKNYERAAVRAGNMYQKALAELKKKMAKVTVPDPLTAAAAA